MIDEATRCGYSRCRAELPAPGPQGGRRRSFCRDTRWESAGDRGGRTCAQMARAEREALGALGLDSGGTAFGLDADRLREHVDAVRGPVGELGAALDAVLRRLDEVQRDAVDAVGSANARVADAERLRVAAEEARDEAVARARRAAESAERAGKERAEATERAGSAARQALEATEALGAARETAERAVSDRTAAEERAERDRAQREVAEARAERSAAEADAARARAAEWQALGESARTERDAARREQRRAEATAEAARADLGRAIDATAAAVAAQGRAERQSVDAGGMAAQDRAARERVERELLTAVERAEGERALRERADAELDRLRAELADTRSRHTAELRDLLTAPRDTP
ncbi:response regulator receiver protein [Pseudonocardia abyssalis]|uniref:Response regulator receiver protein n=1 Tax=Pseudonocardia abyssalis TaxID=2792008 RepID=A0ABS6UPP1_9PSEU|nr:response regulator receiver protein [Pseudonocardia abyssalis]MBW0118144.1 response regulator receiver protein [Pseudonocardia abyssalis]MBW0134221.1 response regulator receiver protein [Pseudonocardia abyssalis]